MNLRVILLVLVGASVGVSLGAMAMHIVALLRTHDWRGQLGYILSKLGWALVMLPLLKAIAAAPFVAGSGIAYAFAVGVAVASVGFSLVAIDVNRTNRILAASAAREEKSGGK